MIQDSRTYQAQFLAELGFRMSAQFTVYNQHINVNSPFFDWILTPQAIWICR